LEPTDRTPANGWSGSYCRAIGTPRRLLMAKYCRSDLTRVSFLWLHPSRRAAHALIARRRPQINASATRASHRGPERPRQRRQNPGVYQSQTARSRPFGGRGAVQKPAVARANDAPYRLGKHGGVQQRRRSQSLPRSPHRRAQSNIGDAFDAERPATGMLMTKSSGRLHLAGRRVGAFRMRAV
jgi:hypothetical protein